MNILAGIYSWPFGIGVLIGLGLDRAWRYAYTAWLNRRRPLPGNRKRRPPGINFTALAVALAIAVVLFSVYKVQSTANTTQQIIRDARAFTAQVRDCQRQFNEALQARARITSENDELSQTQRRIVYRWIHDLIFPPEPYASMPPEDPRRQDYGLALTIDIDREFRASLSRQDQLQRERDAHPLPDPTCGR